MLDRALAEQRVMHRNQAADRQSNAEPVLADRGRVGALEEAEQEREALRSALASCEADLRGARAELSALQLAASQRQTLTEQYQRERDDAVIGRVGPIR